MRGEREKSIISAEFEQVQLSQQSSLYVGKYHDAYFRRPWHYHPEFELLLITRGSGTRMVGDHFERFKEGDLVLLGGNLPHAWISDPHYLKDNNEDSCESIFIQFRKKVFGTYFIDIPEMRAIRTILVKAQRGIKVCGHHQKEISIEMNSITQKTPLNQLLTLIHILQMIQETEYQVLASEGYTQQGIFHSEKMTKIHNYLMQNFKEEIDLKSCAGQVNMTASSFCRFFKKHTNVTFSIYLNNLRINFAQKLLRNTEMPIKEIAFECGYTSIAYFNQIFKKITGMSPGQYRG